MVTHHAYAGPVRANARRRQVCAYRGACVGAVSVSACPVRGTQVLWTACAASAYTDRDTSAATPSHGSTVPGQGGRTYTEHGLAHQLTHFQRLR
jgi:hypothetical protein